MNIKEFDAIIEEYIETYSDDGELYGIEERIIHFIKSKLK